MTARPAQGNMDEQIDVWDYFDRKEETLLRMKLDCLLIGKGRFWLVCTCQKLHDFFNYNDVVVWFMLQVMNKVSQAFISLLISFYYLLIAGSDWYWFFYLFTFNYKMMMVMECTIY